MSDHGFSVEFLPEYEAEEPPPPPPIRPFYGPTSADKARSLRDLARAVEEHAERLREARHTKTVPARWVVSLPHQCGPWIIAEGDRADVINELTEFIDQAYRARNALLAEREIGDTQA